MRYFFPLFLLAGVIFGTGCNRRSSTGISVDSVFRPLIPPDTKALAGVDLEKIKRTALYERHQNELKFPILDASSERVGLDPRRDISDVVIAWNGKQPVFLVRGRFTPKDVEQKLRALGAQRTSYKAYTLIGGENDSVLFTKKGLAVAGSSDVLRSVIDLQNSGGGGIPKELEQRIRTLPKSDQIWAASRGGLAFAEMPMRSDIGSALSNITSYVSGTTLGIGLDTGVHLQADISCVSDQGAQRVRDALRGGIGLARLTTKDNEQDLLRMYDSIQVDQDQQTVHIRADLPGDLTDKLLAYLPQLRSRAGGVF